VITDADIEKAIDWLSRNAVPAAKARAERLYIEAWVKTVLAQEMQKHAALPISAQEREGRTAVPYLAALQAMKEAVQADETARFLREAASAKIEAWRTMESTRRAEGRATQ
jgi:uncharacterized protein YchJ